jgi:hypothetical protein
MSVLQQPEQGGGIAATSKAYYLRRAFSKLITENDVENK